ncbi:hypothetical protein EDB89DRAFT_1901137 [Lactarius sanguifluus]|nr:hypothetical protein EDB89DRAFT_1901137 [Lactarius sanguifluus]
MQAHADCGYAGVKGLGPHASGHLGRERVVFESLRLRASTARWGMQGVHGYRGRVGVEGLKLRVSAATSGGERGSVGRRWSETVVHASVWRKTPYRWPPGLGMRWVRVAKATRKCGMQGQHGRKKAGPEVSDSGNKNRKPRAAVRWTKAIAARLLNCPELWDWLLNWCGATLEAKT